MRALQHFARLAKISQINLRQGRLDIGVNQSRFARERLLIVVIGEFVVAFVECDETFRGVRQSELRGDEIRFVIVFHAEIVETVVEEDCGAIRTGGVEVGIDLDGGVECAKRGANQEAAAWRPRDPCSRAERVAIDGIELERAIHGLLGAREPFGIGLEMHADLTAHGGQQAPGVAEIGIEVDGALEHFDGGGEIELVEAHRAIHGAHVKLEGEGVTRGGNVGA